MQHAPAISDDRLQEFIKAYKEDFGEDLTEQKARLIMVKLVQFYTLVLQPLPPDVPGNTTSSQECS